MKLNKKRWTILGIGLLLLFWGSVFYRNITTYISMKDHPGFVYGKVRGVLKSKGSWNCGYEYQINGKTYNSVQGGERKAGDTVLIVYDTTAPRFSMIVDYPLPFLKDSIGNLLQPDTMAVRYSYWDYLPGGEIRSLKDVWCLD